MIMRIIGYFKDILTIITMIWAVITIAKTASKDAKAPTAKLEDRVSRLEQRMDEAEKKLDRDYKRMNEQERFMYLSMRGLTALISHALNGDNEQEMRDVMAQINSVIYPTRGEGSEI